MPYINIICLYFIFIVFLFFLSFVFGEHTGGGYLHGFNF